MNKITNGKIEINAGRAAAYTVIALAGLWFFAYYDRVFSFAFIIALLLASISSCAATAKAAAEIFASINISHDIADKEEEIVMTLIIKSGRRIPIPFFYVKIYNEWLLTGSVSDEQYVISVSASRPGIIAKCYKAKIWGTASLGVKEIAIHDYMGLFRITYTGRCDMPAASVSIRPALHESMRNDYLANICNRIASEEKDEDHSVKRSFLSQPGYMYRPYVSGDPLKLVNWKLSARFGQYMVRENEYLKTQIPVIILDRVGIRHTSPPGMLKKAAFLEERVVESVLAMLDSMVKQSLSCKICYYLENAWHVLAVEDHEQILALRHVFSQYVFESAAETRLPEEVVSKGGMIAVFTCALDEGLSGEITRAAGSGAAIDVISPNASDYDTENRWTVNESFEFYSSV